MMFTKRFEDVARDPDDVSVIAALKICGRHRDLAEKILRIALLGPDGRAYRLILAEGQADFDEVLGCLAPQGFRPVEGYAGMDAVLGRDLPSATIKMLSELQRA